MIRNATPEDLPRILELGAQSLVDGPYAGRIKNSPEQAARLALETILHANGKVLLLENEAGLIVGILGFFVFPHYFTGEPTATEIIWYVLPEERKGGGGLQLLWQAEKEAKEIGAIRMGFTAPNSDVAAIYQRFGYQQVEVSFMKDL